MSSTIRQRDQATARIHELATICERNREEFRDKVKRRTKSWILDPLLATRVVFPMVEYTGQVRNDI